MPKPIIDMIPEASNNIPLMLGYNNNDTLIFQVMRRLYTGAPFTFSDLNETIPSDLVLTNDERLDIISSIERTFFESGEVKMFVYFQEENRPTFSKSFKIKRVAYWNCPNRSESWYNI